MSDFKRNLLNGTTLSEQASTLADFRRTGRLWGVNCLKCIVEAWRDGGVRDPAAHRKYFYDTAIPDKRRELLAGGASDAEIKAYVDAATATLLDGMAEFAASMEAAPQA